MALRSGCINWRKRRKEKDEWEGWEKNKSSMVGRYGTVFKLHGNDGVKQNDTIDDR